VVREVVEGCATIEVGVPCGGCSQVSCSARRAAGLIQLAAADIQPGEPVRLSLEINALTRASLALFGPPLAWLALSGLLLANPPEGWPGGQPLGAVLFGCGMVIALGLGSWLGQRAGQGLAIDPEPVIPQRLAGFRAQPEPLNQRDDLFR
jgi:hypothetical protein